MAETQRLNTQILLDAALTGGYKDAFKSAGRLMSTLKRQSTDLRKQLGVLGKEADKVEKIGGAADEVRQSMKLLERQIEHTERATQKFGDARSHFRKASIGARAFKSDIGAITNMAKKAAIAVGAIGLGAGYVAHRGLEKYSNFDQILNTLRAEGVADVDIPEIRDQVLKFAGQTRFTALEIGELLVSMKKDGQEVNSELRGFGNLLKFAVAENKDILTAWDVTRTYINSTNTSLEDAIKLQEELSNATSLSKLQIEDYGFIAGKALSTFANLENFDTKGFNALAGLLADTGVQAETVGITLRRFPLVLAEAAHGKLAGEKQTLFDQLGIDIANSKGELKDIVTILSEFNRAFTERGYITADNKISTLGLTQLGGIFDTRYADAIGKMITKYEEVEASIGGIGKAGTLDEKFDVHSKTLFAARKRFESAFESFSLNLFQIFDDDDNFIQMFDGMTAGVNRFLSFIIDRKEQIQNFFTGIHDGVSPVVSRVWNTIREAYPDVKQFAVDVWTELKKQWDAVAPVAGFVANQIWAIVKAVTGFMRDHPRLVATVIAGVAAWKGYKIVSNIFGTAGDAIMGFVSLAQGHFHRLNAMVLGNIRMQDGLQKTTLSTGQKFLTMGKDMVATKFPKLGTVASGAANIGKSALAAIPGIGAMGASLWASIAPILPVALPIIGVIGGIAAGGYLIYKNWEGVKSFFTDNFETIRNVMWLVAPPIGFLMTAGQFIMQNWEPIKDFFSTLWETVTLVFQTGVEAIKFVVLQGALAAKKAWEGITGFFKGIWDGVTGIFTKSPLAPVFNWMVGSVKKVVSPLFSFFDDFWDNIFDKGKAVIQWITDKFNFVNNLLKKAFGWLRKKNEEAVAELKEQSGGVIEAQVDVPDAVASVNQEIDAVLQTQQPEPAVVELQQPEVYNEVKVGATPVETEIGVENPSHNISISPQVNVQPVEIPEAETAELPDMASPQIAVQSAQIPAPQISIPPQQVIQAAAPVVNMADGTRSVPATMSDEVVKIELGLLAESRKQTNILLKLASMTPTELEKYSDTHFVQLQKVETETSTSIVEMRGRDSEIAPTVEIPSRESEIAPTPVMPAPMVENEITSPTVQNDISVSPAVVNVQMPEPAATEIQKTDGDPRRVPTTVQVQQPKVDVPQAAAAEVKNQIDVNTPDGQIATADPPVVDTHMYTSAAEQIQQPQKEITQTLAPEVVNQIDVASPEVDVAKPDPAVVDMQTSELSITEIQQAKVEVPKPPVPEVVNQTAVTQAEVQMAETASSDIQQPVVELRSPSADTTPSPAEYLKDMTPEPQRTDVFGDALVRVGLGILSETRKQTGIIETLSLEPVLETAPVVMETPGLVVDDSGLNLDDYGQPAETSQGQQITNHEQVTHQTSAPTVEVVNHFQIVQQPDQDPEALAELIAAIVMDKVDESADTFLVT